MHLMEKRLARLENSLNQAQSRARRMAALTAAVVIGAAALYLVPGATAQSGQGQAHGIAHRVKTLEDKVAALQAGLAAETAARIAADLQLQANINAEAAARAAADATLQGNIDAEAAARIAADNTLQSQITPMSAVLQPFSKVGNDLIITGVNLHIRNGSGGTSNLNALGNLIVGYNEGAFPAGQIGSHNIVVGLNHTFTSFGGLVAGLANRISAPHASVTGGFGNEAAGQFSSVSGGNAITQSSLAGWSAGNQVAAPNTVGNFRSP